VLQLVLLVGGLFVLGLLCGEQARAADGAGPAPAVDTPVTDRVVDGLVRPVAQQVVRPVTQQVVRPVTGLVVSPAAEHVVRPIGDLVDRITEEIAGQPVPPLYPPTLPGPPTLPTLPTVPTLPDVPGPPEVPGSPLPEVPGRTLPADTPAPQQPDGAADGTADGDQAAGRQPTKTRAAEKRSAGTRSPGEGGAAAFGPRFAHGLGVAGDAAPHRPHPRASGVTRIAQAPVHQVPDGDPSGALRNHRAVDSGPPRYGDPQAVTPNGGTRPTLVPGAAADLTAAATRDRHRDIPASPG
jgi:hypothetical protein